MKNNTKILVLCALAVVINVVLGETVSALKIPLLFLDTIGTIFIAATFGMGYGILTGVTTNVLMGFLSGNFVALPFALVSVAVAIVVSLVAKYKDGKFTYIKALIAGLLLSFVAPMIGAPIRLALFGGLTGSGTDIIILALKQAGQQMITATYWGAVSSNFVDKMVSCLLVAAVLSNRQVQRTLQQF